MPPQRCGDLRIRERSGEILIPLTERYNIPQGYRPLFDSQDRIREKTNARDNGLRVPRFAEVHDRESLMKGIFEIGYPCVFKTRTLGYDGHGQAVIRTPEDIARRNPIWGYRPFWRSSCRSITRRASSW